MPGTRSAPPVRARRAVLFAVATVVAIVGMPSIADAAKKPKVVVTFSAGDQTMYGVGDAPQSLPDDVRDKVLGALSTYVTAATVKPLQKGAVDDAALATAFDATATARATTTDRGVVVDDGVPKAVKKVKVTTNPVKLTGLVDEQGKVVVVTAALDTTTTAKTAKGPVTIKRTGELVFSPADGTWKVSGYDLKVDRTGKPFDPAATATPTATTPTTVKK